MIACNSGTGEQEKPSTEATGSAVTIENAKLNDDERIATPYGEIELQHTYITDESSQKLFDAMGLQRASQAYIWSTPLVSFTTWRKEQDKDYGPNARGTFAVFVSFKEK